MPGRLQAPHARLPATVRTGLHEPRALVSRAPGWWTTGKPIDPRRDLTDWKALLEEAGVRRDARLYDARHTAATVRLLLGVPDRAVMEFMGWSKSAMAKRYQHMTAVLRG